MFEEITQRDEAIFVELMREFYHSPAVLHAIPDRHFTDTFHEITNGSPYAEAFLFRENGQIAGYGLLAKTYSNEAGGLVVWLEEIYIREAFRGTGLGSRFFRFVEERYAGKAARLRLEVESDNEGAIRLYKRLGYEALPYQQMIKTPQTDGRE